MDLSILQDFEPKVSQSWNNWEFNHQEYSNFPLTFFSRMDRVGKYCDLSQASTRAQQSEFIVVEGNTKQRNKHYIPKDSTTTREKKINYYPTKVQTKKNKKNWRPYLNQNKTKFKQITVKNDWKMIKNINKNFLENINQPKIKIETIQTRGKLRLLNQEVQRISWSKRQFKQNQEYIIQPIQTTKDRFLKNKMIEIITSKDQEAKKQKTLVCSLEFLLAIMTVKGGQYPWNIMIQKLGNLITMGNYHDSTETDKFSYIDLFTVNQNTNNNMPKDQTKVKQNCVNATKLTKIFKDLLASGDFLEEESQEQQQENESNNQQKKQKKDDEEQQQNQSQEEEPEPQHLQKYLKISMDDIDIYTKVSIDGVKKKSDGSFEQCLIRAFVETETDGAWIQDINESTGKIITQQYQSNACNLQKWILQARLAGVNLIKAGYMGQAKKQPFILNVDEMTVNSWEKFLSFKIADCWPILNRILGFIFSSDDGAYVLSRNAYFPLSMKLYQLPQKDAQEEEEEDEGNKQ